jgi:hypothetical protein
MCIFQSGVQFGQFAISANEGALRWKVDEVSSALSVGKRA